MCKCACIKNMNIYTWHKLWTKCVLIRNLILGVVIGALKPPDRRYMERRIPFSSFQQPSFENKQYLDDAVKIAEEIVKVTQPHGNPLQILLGYRQPLIARADISRYMCT